MKYRHRLAENPSFSESRKLNKSTTNDLRRKRLAQQNELQIAAQNT